MNILNDEKYSSRWNHIKDIWANICGSTLKRSANVRTLGSRINVFLKRCRRNRLGMTPTCCNRVPGPRNRVASAWNSIIISLNNVIPEDHIARYYSHMIDDRFGFVAELSWHFHFSFRWSFVFEWYSKQRWAFEYVKFHFNFELLFIQFENLSAIKFIN